MLQFKIRYVSSMSREIEAQRAVRDDSVVSFESYSDDGWIAAVQIPVEEIQSIRRRITDLDGNWRWISFRAQYALDGPAPRVSPVT